MLFLLASLAAAAPVAVPIADGAAKSANRCPAPTITFALSGPNPKGLRRLGDEPSANEYLAVERNVGGCPAPAVVRTGIRR